MCHGSLLSHHVCVSLLFFVFSVYPIKHWFVSTTFCQHFLSQRWVGLFFSAGSFIHLFATLPSQENVILWMNIWWMNALNIHSPYCMALLKLLKCWLTFPWLYPWDQLHWEGSIGQIFHFQLCQYLQATWFLPKSLPQWLVYQWISQIQTSPQMMVFFPHTGSFRRTSVVRKNLLRSIQVTTFSKEQLEQNSKQFPRSNWNPSFVALLLQATTSKEN